MTDGKELRKPIQGSERKQYGQPATEKTHYMKKWGFILLKIGVTTGLLAWLIGSLDLAGAVTQLNRARIDYLILTLVVIWVGHFLCVLRWKVILAALEISMKTLSLVLIYGIGMFFNLVFPGLVGGDLVKMYLTGRDSGQSYSIAFASVFADRYMGFMAMVLLAVLSSAAYPIRIQGYNLFLSFLGLLGVSILGSLILFYPGAHKVALRLLSVRIFHGFIEKANVLFEAFSKVRRRRSSLALALYLSLINQFIVICASWLIALSLDIHAPFHYFMVFVPATVVITMIPISINGVGLREFAYMSFFSAIGVSRQEGVLIGFLSSLVIIASGLPGSIAYMLHKNEVSRGELAAYESRIARDIKMP